MEDVGQHSHSLQSHCAKSTRSKGGESRTQRHAQVRPTYPRTVKPFKNSVGPLSRQ
jgi:hypothetical protein